MNKTHFIEDLLADETVRYKMTDWAKRIAFNSPDREAVARICARVGAIFTTAITMELMEAIEQQRQIDKSFPV